jgi:urease accessory protein
VIAVQIVPDEILIAHPASIAQAVEVAHALGNRHIPIIREGDAIVVGYVPALEDLFGTLGVRFERVARVLERPFVYAHAPHAHG